jgi:hypothetical protein
MQWLGQRLKALYWARKVGQVTGAEYGQRREFLHGVAARQRPE